MQQKIDTLNAKLNNEYCNKCEELGKKILNIEIFATEIGEKLDILKYSCDQFGKCFKINNHGINEYVRSLKLCIPHLNMENHVAGKKNNNIQGTNNGLNPNSAIFEPIENISDKTKNKNNMPLKKSNAKKDENGNFIAPKKNHTSEKENKAKKDENGNFHAPKKNTTREKENSVKSEGLLNIYVGPFETHITSNDIESHIVSKIKCKDKRVFKVEQLNGQNDTKQKTYVSFKISTLSDDIYKMLLSKDVWGPNQSARPYKNDSPKGNYGYQRHFGSKFQRSNFRRPNRYNDDRNGSWKKSNAPYIPRFERENRRDSDERKKYESNRKYDDEREKREPRRNYEDRRYDKNYRNKYQSQEDDRKSRQDDFFDRNYQHEKNRLNPSSSYKSSRHRSRSRESIRSRR